MRTVSLLLLMSVTAANVARADVFGSGANAFDIEFVTIGNPGNPADTTGAPNPAGSVDYSYRIGKYEISRDIVDKAIDGGGLAITVDQIPFTSPTMAAVGISWFEAAKFANWLNTSTGHQPAYKFVGSRSSIFEPWQPGDLGYDASNPFRNSEAYYFLPSNDEWYKAAYYDANAGTYYDYPTGSDTAPTPVVGGTDAGTAVYSDPLNPVFDSIALDPTQAGGLSPFGTMGQGGNVQEWVETEYELVLSPGVTVSRRSNRGGHASSHSSALLASSWFHDDPSFESFTVGFRVASRIPEPSTLLLGLVGLGLLLRTKRTAR